MKTSDGNIDPKMQPAQAEAKAESPRKAAAAANEQDADPKKAPKGQKTAPAEPKEAPAKENKKVNFIGKLLLSVIDGSFLTRDNMLKSVPYFFFLAFLAIIYIANTYYAERMVRITDRTKHELKELRYEHITTKSQLMSLSKQSEVVKRLLGTGLKESVVPPEKIFIKEDPAKAEKSKMYWLPKTYGE